MFFYLCGIYCQGVAEDLTDFFAIEDHVGDDKGGEGDRPRERIDHIKHGYVLIGIKNGKHPHDTEQARAKEGDDGGGKGKSDGAEHGRAYLH